MSALCAALAARSTTIRHAWRSLLCPCHDHASLTCLEFMIRIGILDGEERRTVQSYSDSNVTVLPSQTMLRGHVRPNRDRYHTTQPEYLRV